LKELRNTTSAWIQVCVVVQLNSCKIMGLWDEKAWKIDQPIGVKSEADQRSINIERQRAQFLGKVMREARRNGDLKGYLAVEAAGYKDRGIENVDDKNRRFLDKVQQDRFYGDRAVGPGQQPAGNAQQPARGAAMGNGRGGSPENARGAAQGSSGGQWVNVGGAPLGGTQHPTGSVQQPMGAQPVAPVQGRDSQGRPISMIDQEGRPISPVDGYQKLSAAEESKRATLEKTLAGNFGKVAQARAEAQQSGGTYDATPGFTTRTEGRAAFVKGVEDAEKQGFNWQNSSEEEKEAFLKKGKDLGLTEDQIGDVVAGYGKEEGGLSPASMAKRAAERKASYYNTEFGDSDKTMADSLKGLSEPDPVTGKPKFTPDQIAQIRKNIAGLSPQQRKDSLEKAAASRTEREETKIREKEGTGAPDTYSPLGEALDRANKLADESIASAASRSEEFKTLQESNDKARQEDKYYISISDCTY
jgi:hypothetical protein